MPLDEWELRFEFELREMPASQRGRVGAVLPVIPAGDEWEQFLADIRKEWRHWEWRLKTHPGCMVVLYDGVAFFHYRSGAFWDDFARIVGSELDQSALNRIYTKAAKQFGLHIYQGDYVASAVLHIGIPVSMWEPFLDICEWALWTDEWHELDERGWGEAITRRLRGRALLTNFLVENRSTATKFIREMLDARRTLAADLTASVGSIAQSSILRPEYFDEVPETADFLRPRSHESLMRGRAMLAWNEERQTISLSLPSTSPALLPAKWRCGGHEQSAVSTASELVLDGAAFEKTIRLELVAPGISDPQRIAGINGWALYDESRRRFVNWERELLPVSSYTLISRQALNPQLDGWLHDPDEPRIDLPFSLLDGTPVFLTQLLPASRRPKLKIGDGGWIKFAQRRGVELRVFCGDNQSTAARFSFAGDGVICTESWPRPFLEVPLSLVPDDNVPAEFTVFLDGQPARGKWRLYEFDPRTADADSAECAFYHWAWDAAELKGRHVLHVESQKLGRLQFGDAEECRFELVPRTRDSVWPTVWGDYIMWVLLAQVQDDATWSEVQFAREAVTGYANVNPNAVYHQIRKLERHGYLDNRGHCYRNFRSRIVLGKTPCEYCGLTSLLYDLVRLIPPRKIAVAPQEAARPAKLHIEWPQQERSEVRVACLKLGIEFTDRLW